MKVEPHMRGGVTVGQLAAMLPWEALLVRHLRLWCDGVTGRAQVQRELTTSEAATVTFGTFDELINIMMTFARRPLLCHGLECQCLGADEAVFVQIVAAACSGQLDDAALMAGLIAFPAHAETIAILAGQLGMAYQLMRPTTEASAMARSALSGQRFH